MNLDLRKEHIGKQIVISHFGDDVNDLYPKYYLVWKGIVLTIQAIDHKGMVYAQGIDKYGREKMVFVDFWRIRFLSNLEEGCEEL